MVESQIVILVVAGSNPVGHPTQNLPRGHRLRVEAEETIAKAASTLRSASHHIV